jgi:hypothetical protein
MSGDLVYHGLQVLGAIAAFIFAFRSFERRSIKLGEEPTLPRYFAPRGWYRLGIISYSTFMALVLLALISVWLPLRPLVDGVASTLAAHDPQALLASLTSTALIPLIAAALFLFLLAFESRFNPVLLVRDAVYDMFAIPRKAHEVYNVLRTSRLAGVDAAVRAESLARLNAPSLDAGDFDKANDTVEYKWARNCVLFGKIQSYAEQDSFRRFFKEPSLKWGQICLSFNEASEKVASWKSAEPHYTKTLSLMQQLDHLTNLLCRLLACLVVFGSASDKEMWETVVRLGGDPRQARLKHTYKYLLTFSGAIVLAIAIGRELAVALYNGLFEPDATLEHFAIDTFRWMLYAVMMYILPIGLVFAARVEAYRMAASDTTQYYGFYVTMMLIGFLLSASVSALVTGLGPAEQGQFHFGRAFLNSMPWGILPALMCGFVAFQMDRPVDETESLGHMWGAALLRLLAWAALGLVIMLYATSNISAHQHGLRFVLVVTTAFVSGFLGAVTRFKVVQAPM